MIVLSSLQVILGLLVTFTSWTLKDARAQVVLSVPVNGVYTRFNRGFSDATFEFVLLFFGLVILTCGYFQRKAHVKYTGIQIAVGFILAGISGVLAIIATIKGSGEIPAVYFLSYLQIVLGLLVFATGITQVIHGLSTGAVKSRKND
jgi:uncharacterized membrane protein